MAYQPKSYRKFLAGSVSAALVASIVTPAVAAEVKTFPDVENIQDAETKAAIYALADLGVINGYADGNFGPYNNVTRGQVAKMLVKFLGLEVSEAQGTFSDLPATHEFAAYAEALQEAGYLNGYADGSFGVNNPINRAGLAKILVNAFGLTATEDEVSYTDLDLITSAEDREKVAIAAQNGLFKDADKFNPYGQMNRSGFALVLYRLAGEAVVGVELTDAVSVNSTTLEVTLAEANLELTAEDFVVEVDGEAVEVTVEANEDGSVYTLTHADLAGTAGTLTVNGLDVDFDYTVSSVSVDSVSAIDNKRIKVVFSDSFVAAGFNAASTELSVDGFTITDKDGKAIELESAVLQNDGKTVILTAKNEMTPGLAFTLKVANVQNSDVAHTVVAKPADSTKPVASTVTAISNTLVKVVFDSTDATDESILDPANYVINNDVTVESVAFVSSSKTNELYLTTSPQSAGKVYTLTVNGVEDYSGNVITETKLQFAGKAEDKTAPTVSTATARSGKFVTVTFSDASQLDAAALSNVANYSINNELTVEKVEVISNSIENNTKTVKLTTSTQTAGKVYKLTVDNLADVYGNVPSTDLTVNFAGTALDTTGPNVTSATAKSNTKVEVVFHEELTKEDAIAIANYSIDGLEITGASFDESTTSGTYLRKVTLTTSAQTAGKVYEVVVSNVKDELGNAITTSQTYKFKFAGKGADTVKPGVESTIGKAGNKVEIKFTEDVTEASAETLTNYVINGDLGYPTSAVYSASTRTVTLTTANQSNGKVYEVKINNIVDEAGNAITADTKVSFAGVGSSLDALKLESVVALNKRQIQVTFNKDVDNGTVAKSDFNLKKGSDAYVDINTMVGADLDRVDGKTYIITLPTANALTTDIYTLQVDSEIKDLGGTALSTTDTAKSVVSFGGVDSNPATPKVSTVTQVSQKTLEVTFEDKVNVTTFGAVGEVYVTYTKSDGTTVTRNLATTSSYTVDSTDAHKVRFLFADAIEGNQVAKLVFHADGFDDVNDVTGNFSMVAPSGATNYEVSFGTVDYAATGLKLSSAVAIDEQTIELEFNQDILFNSGAALTNPGAGTDDNFLQLKVNGGAKVVGYDLKYAEKTASNKVRVYFTPGSNFSEGSLYDVVITDNAAGDALFTTLDGVGLDASVTNDAKAVFGYNAAENKGPELLSVIPLSDTVVQITFSESLSVDPTTDATAGTAIEFYNGTTQIAHGQLGAFTDVSNGAKRVYTVELSGGKFLAGTTYKVKMPNGLTITDKFGVDAIKKSATTDVFVTFGGIATAATTPDVSDFAFSNLATEEVTSTTGVAQNAFKTLEVYVGTTAPTAATVAEYTYDLTGAALTAATGAALTAVTDTSDAGDTVYYRYVDQANNVSAWVADGQLVDNVVAGNIVISDNTATSDAATGDTIVLTSDTTASNTKWADSKLQDGDKIVITFGTETLTYTLQSGDMAKLKGSTNITITVGTTTTGVAYSGTTGTAAAFDAALTAVDNGSVTVVSSTGNKSVTTGSWATTDN
ncbi:S-layer homology domain-containing protein [Bacillus salitolerans]|uniref:S-layer homology domain-containing protein n=1 Tax=Bacillus salitolerans TaxID=1437434 RepID=A0ABW4LR09_9BACI